jgi:hypothetical protein
LWYIYYLNVNRAKSGDSFLLYLLLECEKSKKMGIPFILLIIYYLECEKSNFNSHFYYLCLYYYLDVIIVKREKIK